MCQRRQPTRQPKEEWPWKDHHDQRAKRTRHAKRSRRSVHRHANPIAKSEVKPNWIFHEDTCRWVHGMIVASSFLTRRSKKALTLTWLLQRICCHNKKKKNNNLQFWLNNKNQTTMNFRQAASLFFLVLCSWHPQAFLLAEATGENHQDDSHEHNLAPPLDGNQAKHYLRRQVKNQKKSDDDEPSVCDSLEGSARGLCQSFCIAKNCPHDEKKQEGSCKELSGLEAQLSKNNWFGNIAL
mmetsp:Transcript_31005/g.64699  ORF Transcript_31005/g.64699 Transcript_31005/m.64699 type:complete len:239 (-) Transcript_31005:895-1611(-)